VTTTPKPPGPWDDFAIRCIGVYKLAKAIGAIFCSCYLIYISNKNLPDVLKSIITFLRLSPEGRIVQTVTSYIMAHSTSVTPTGMRLFAEVLLVYSAIFAIEGYGLYFRKTWGEYLVTVSTSIPLPFEIYLLIHEFGWGKVALIIGNLAILAFLIHRIIEERRVAHSRKLAELKAENTASSAQVPGSIQSPMPGASSPQR
jgi:uncharacterized membrane protein (DUF2068 family)